MKVILGLFSYGGVEESTVDAVLRELSWAYKNNVNIAYNRFSGDALISRSRSRVLGKFFNDPQGADVLVMVDHDITWRPGDLCYIAQQACESNSLVGGLYCKRAFKRGWSSRVPFNGQLHFGQLPGKLVKTEYLATGFLAIPYSAVKCIVDKLFIESEEYKSRQDQLLKDGNLKELLRLHDMSISRIADGAWKKVEHQYYDFFRCFRIPSGVQSSVQRTEQFLSEDWAFSQRANYAGVDSYLSSYPVLVHHGSHGYTIPDGMDDELVKANNATQTDTKKPEGQIPGAGGT